MEFHKYQLMETLDLHTSADLIHFAIKNGLVELLTLPPPVEQHSGSLAILVELLSCETPRHVSEVTACVRCPSP